jgi:hypothetical protein
VGWSPTQIVSSHQLSKPENPDKTVKTLSLLVGKPARLKRGKSARASGTNPNSLLNFSNISLG